VGVLAMTMDLEALSLVEIIRLQGQLTEALKRRFERTLALVFTDVVGSTAYFARHGDAAGRALQQRHLDLLASVLPAQQGRVVDTAGDGAFTVFPTVEGAAGALVRLLELIAQHNTGYDPEHKMAIRAGLHWGKVLTDGALVSGDAVNLCARVAGTGEGAELRCTRDAFHELSKEWRLRCRQLGAVALKGLPDPVHLVSLVWQVKRKLPTHVRIRETGERFPLPDKDVISFGRLREQNGVVANDVVLSLPDRNLTQQLSRWHFELHRAGDGFSVRAVSNQPITVDGQTLARGAELPIRAGSLIHLSGIMELVFQSEDDDDGGLGVETLAIPHGGIPRPHR
jgi:class 3 adenylate cyclase